MPILCGTRTRGRTSGRENQLALNKGGQAYNVATYITRSEDFFLYNWGGTEQDTSASTYFTLHAPEARNGKVMSTALKKNRVRTATGLGRMENTGKSSAANCTGRKNDLSQSAEELGLARRGWRDLQPACGDRLGKHLVRVRREEPAQLCAPAAIQLEHRLFARCRARRAA